MFLRDRSAWKREQTERVCGRQEILINRPAENLNIWPKKILDFFPRKTWLIYFDKHSTFKIHATVLTLKMSVTFTQMDICERIEFNRHSQLENNSCFPKKEINRFDRKCEMVCGMFTLCTVPLRENFTGNCWSELLGGKTCHMPATKLFPNTLYVYGLESVILFRK